MVVLVDLFALVDEVVECCHVTLVGLLALPPQLLAHIALRAQRVTTVALVGPKTSLQLCYFVFHLGVDHLLVAQVLQVLLHQALLTGQTGELLAVLVDLVKATVEQGNFLLQLDGLLVITVHLVRLLIQILTWRKARVVLVVRLAMDW